MESDSFVRRNGFALTTGFLLAAGMYLARLYNYLLFHSVAEVFTVAVACSIFLVSWNARNFEKNGYFLFLGIGCLFAGALSVLHALAYKGMGVFPGQDANLPTQLWIAARSVIAITLLLAPGFAGRGFDHRVALAAYAVCVSLLLASIRWGFFPACFVEGAGLTPFKVYGEFAISAVILASLALLWKKKEHFDRRVLLLLLLSAAVAVVAELAFTLYRRDVYGTFNLAGHYLIIVAYYLAYKAVIGTEFVRKYELNESLTRELEERKRLQEKLGRAKDEWERTFDSVPDMIAILDDRHRIVRVNEAMAKRLKRATRECIGHPCYEHMHGLSEPPPFCPHSRTLADGRQHVEEVHEEHLGGHFLVSTTPLLDGQGHRTGSVHVARDITLRKKAEEALRKAHDDLEVRVRERTAELVEANQELAALIDSSPLAIVVRDPGERVMLWNPAAERMFGWTQEEVLGRPLPIVPPWEMERFLSLRNDVLEGRPLTRLEQTRLRNDGTPIEVSTSTTLLRHAEGNVRGIMTIYEDITDRKRMELELQESEARFRSLVQNSPAGFCLAREGRILFANAEMERMFGAIPPLFEFSKYKGIHSEDRAKFERFCDALAQSDPPVLEDEIRVLSAGGSSGRDICFVHFRTNPIDYYGENATLVSLMDITRLKELEYLARTREKMAALGHVAAGIAHEIRNPLSGFNIYLSTLERVFEGSDGLEPENREMSRNVIEQLKSASGKIESVIRRVMNFTRPTPPTLVPSDINKAVEEALALSQVSLRKQGVRVALSLGRALPLVRADIQLIEQVILNLVANAAQAMEKSKGPRDIEVGTFRDGASVIVSISDSGPGVPRGVRDRIFDPFFTTRSEGTGIGLSICHRIVSDHGGLLTVGTGRLGGAEFRFALPVGMEVSQG